MNKKGTVTVSLGETLNEIEAVAKEENRSISKQLLVIAQDWLAERRARKAQQQKQVTATSRT